MKRSCLFRLMTMVFTLVLCSSVIVSADVVSDVPNSCDENGVALSNCLLTQDATILNVTVPTSSSVHIEDFGGISAPVFYIENNSFGPVYIKDFKVESQNGWSMVTSDKLTIPEINTDFYIKSLTSRVGAKKFMACVGDIIAGNDGYFDTNGIVYDSVSGMRVMLGSKIAGHSKFSVDFMVVPFVQKNSINEVIADLVITISLDDRVTGME